VAQFRAFWRATTAPLRSSDSGPGGLLLHLVLLGMFLRSSLVSRSCGRELVVLCLRLAWLGRRLTAEFVGALSSSELQMLSDAFRRSSPVDPLCCTLEPRRPPLGCGTPSCSYSRTCFCYSPCERPPGGPSTHNLLTRRQIAAWSWRIAMRRHLRWRLQTVELYC
jgi:hypothetical protein